MSMTLDLDRQVFPMLAQIEDDPGRHATEFPMFIGRILHGAPDHSTLRHLRGELAATADRLSGERGVDEGRDSAAVTAGIILSLVRVITGWMEQADATASDAATSGLFFRARILAALADGPVRPSDLADKLGKSRPQISEALARLKERELVTDAESAVDGRSRLYELTDKGRAAATA